ncbi:MAG TPA: formyltransferase family protein, partial [Candidatus Limnocylindrales bacterium]|nr:formyltransferase family protein [Candidatus Limnocylindrales bacterium]
HPSLLPRHGGKGMVGLAVHRSVLAAGDLETGVSVHQVTAELDSGPMLAQVRGVLVISGESAEQLAARVLAVEHQVVVEVLARLAAEPLAGGASASMAALPPATGTHAKHERRRTHA